MLHLLIYMYLVISSDMSIKEYFGARLYESLRRSTTLSMHSIMRDTRCLAARLIIHEFIRPSSRHHLVFIYGLELQFDLKLLVRITLLKHESYHPMFSSPRSVA